MIKELFGEDYVLLLNNQDILEKTLIIVEKVFRNITDKQGKPYIGHLLRVSNRLSSITEKVVGLLHDIVEDTEVTFDELIELGYSLEIVDAIDLLTKKDMGDNHSKRVDRLLKSNNLLAITVKKADIEDNSDENRLKEVEEVDSETASRLREKYRVSYAKIIEYLKVEGDRNVRY